MSTASNAVLVIFFNFYLSLRISLTPPDVFFVASYCITPFLLILFEEFSWTSILIPYNFYLFLNFFCLSAVWFIDLGDVYSDTEENIFSLVVL